MKKLVLVFSIILALGAVATASDIGFYVGSPNTDGWYDVPTMQADVETIISMTGSLFADIQQFDDSQLDELGQWVEANTDDGEMDILWLNGCLPSSLYPVGNASPDGSRIENWLDGGNMIINVGDWFGYTTYEGGTRGTDNGSAGAANILDLAAGIIVSADGTTLPVTPTGEEYLPSLMANDPVPTDRPVALSAVVAPWEVAAVFASTDGTDNGAQADPVVIHNTETGAYVAFVNQGGSGHWLDDRGLTCAEFINNWANEFAGLSDPKQAKDPSPLDGETDVLRDVTLSWAPGESATTHNVYFGTSFDDVNDATVANPMGVLVSQGQSGTTLALPETLDFGTIYYWRVDEVSAGVVKGKVWNFTTELYAYAIKNITISANTTSQAGQGPERIIDGSGLNANDEHSTNTNAMWGGTPNPDEPSYLLFEFDGVYKVHELLVWNYNMEFEMFLGLGVKDVTLEYSEDGENWSTLGDFELAQGASRAGYTANTTIPFDGVAAQYVRMTIHSNFSGSPQLYGLSEVRFLSIPVQPSQPQPSDGATGVSLDAMLSWRPGREAASHEVYLGMDPSAMAIAGTTTQPNFSPTIDLDTTYSWQVVEVNNAEAISAWAGDIWTFTTQEYLVVDNFDDYNDDIDAGTTIWQGWVDGIDDPTNGGAVVGNPQSPFAEQTIVRSGQSMNFNYSNSSASAISEADHTLSPAQNWTGNGIKSLSLWFRGATGNTGRLYVKINNTKVTYDGSATDIGTAGWHKWNIVLSETAANLNNVTTLTVGVEGAGTGVVYFDDIHLSPRVSTQPTSDLGIAISAQANWWSQEAANREIEKIVDKAQAPVIVFNTGDQDGLAKWVTDHTNNGQANLLILCGQLPDTIYAAGNTQADDSIVEQFLDAGNTIINTGDWIFYVVNSAGTNGAAGLQTIMDIPGVTVAGGDNTPVTVTAEGLELTPSLQDFATDRPFHLDTLEGDWYAELVLAQNADGTLADPVIVRNSVTGGRIGVFYQTNGQDNDPRGEVMSEWINNWYLEAAGN